MAEFVGAAQSGSHVPPRWIRFAGLTLGIVAAYAALADISTRLSSLSPEVGAFWLPMGLVYAASLAKGRAALPGIFLGQLGYSLAAGSGAASTAWLLACGNVGCAAVIVLLMQAEHTPERSGPRAADDALARPSGLLRSLAAFAAGSVLNTTFGMLAYSPPGTDTWQGAAVYAATFMMGDVGGALLLGPLLLMLWTWRRQDWRTRSWELALLVVPAGLALNTMMDRASPLPLPVVTVLALAILLFTAMRYSQAQASLINALAGISLMWNHTARLGPELGDSPTMATAMAQTLICTLLGTALLTSVFSRRMKDLLARQERVNDTLNRAESLARTGSWRLDLQENRLQWSPQTHRMFGIHDNGAPASYDEFLALVHPEDKTALETQWKAALAGGVYDSTHRVTVKGTTRWMRERAYFEFDPVGNPIRAWGSVQDVTEEVLLREAERDKVGAQAASRAKSAFLATLSHEIRTPLNGVIGLTHLLADDALDDTSRRGHLRQLTDSARLLQNIIDDVLDLSKIEAGRMDIRHEPYRLRALLAQLVDTGDVLARAKGLVVRLHVDPDLPDSLMGDATRVRQVLHNYLSNALKFTESGGIGVTACLRDGRLRIEVNDTGCGISPDALNALFQPFVQVDASDARPHGGTGLGLSICRELARLMGGDVGVTSTPGQGSTFWLNLPLTTAPSAQAHGRMGDAARDAQPAAHARDPSTPVLQGMRILVAEDNPVNTLITRLLLQRTGAIVTCTADGREALMAVRKSREPGSHQPFDLVLMDIQMPGTDGLTATRELRRLEAANPAWPRLPVIAMTAGVLDEQRQQALSAGMDDFVSKPVDISALWAAVTAACPAWAATPPPKPGAAPPGPGSPAGAPRQAGPGS